MLIEVKARVVRLIDSKLRKKTETYILDKEFFSQAEYAVSEYNQSLIESESEDFYITSLRQSSIKEVCTQYEGEHSYIATLKDIFLTDDGTEKPIKYKVLLWANNLSEAHHNTQEIARQGYNMHIEGIKEVDYEYLSSDSSSSQV